MPPRRWLDDFKNFKNDTKSAKGGSAADRLEWLSWAISPTGLGAVLQSSIRVTGRSSAAKGMIIIAWRDDGVDMAIRGRTLAAVIDKGMKAAPLPKPA